MLNLDTILKTKDERKLYLRFCYLLNHKWIFLLALLIAHVLVNIFKDNFC